VLDKFPLGVILSKGLTVRSALQYAQRYMDRMLDHVQEGELDPSFLVTNRLSLEEGAAGLRDFQEEARRLRAGGVRALATPLAT
jgi:threonine dehydrogenase-like Zn-dependent dehydrogenase